MTIKAHGTYFMKQKLYDLANSSLVEEAPFNMLNKNEWLTVFHHLNAHRVEEGISEGYLTECLSGNTDRFFIYELAKGYYDGNHGIDLLPEEEKNIGLKIARILGIVNENYEWVNISDNPSKKVVWDLKEIAQEVA